MPSPSERPLPRDDLAMHGWPVAAAWQPPRSAAASRRTSVTHSYAALSFISEGRLRLEQNGHWALGAGDVLLVPAGQAHRMLESHSVGSWGLSFSVPSLAGSAALLDPFERVRDGGSAVIPIPTARHGFLEALFRELASVTSHGAGYTDGRAAIQQSLLTLIINEVSSAASSQQPIAKSSGSVVVESLRFIERNALRPLTLQEVAKSVGRSPAYVTHALSRATGYSAVEWIIRLRMAEARRLLLHSDEHVDVIAERVGYADATHFIRMFRRHHKATPAAWRAAQLRASPLKRHLTCSPA